LDFQRTAQQANSAQDNEAAHDSEGRLDNGEIEAAAQKEVLVVYAYHENENALANARFFIKHALHNHADFLFLINGDSILEKEIPTYLPNVQMRLRHNLCYDLGSSGQVLLENNRHLVQKYKKFILLNSSIRGPFLPVWSRDCWTDIYTNMVTDVVKVRERISRILGLRTDNIRPLARWNDFQLSRTLFALDDLHHRSNRPEYHAGSLLPNLFYRDV
jgi:hypothetical protein